ncbi:SGNH/GDSL hydrolase family protein [Microbacterium sp. NPDC080220]|uniref:SGNH/GDSL hydrolase family protein n=1 Tax=Microbacterium sp. NPDC080220 TaxID=3161017 RepID=UPI003433BCF7
MIERMGKRRRHRNQDAWWRQQYGGMPVWGLGLAVVALAISAAIAVPAALTPPQRSEAAPRPLPSMYVPAKKPVAVFIGDSYTAGDGLADKVSERWTHLLSTEKGWFEKNYGIGGTGYATVGPIDGADTYLDRLSRIAEDPDIVFVSGGRNDDEGAYEPSVAEFFTALDAAFPDAKIVAIEPFYDSGPYPERLTRLGELVRGEVTKIGGTYVEGVGGALTGHPEWILDDGVHPDAEGHRRLAESVAAAVPPL